MPAQVQKEAPDFTATAVVNEEFKQIKLSDYRGKYVVLFFYPLDFTFVCPTEIVAFSDRIREFRERGAEVIGCSIDSQFSHLAWIQTPRDKGGLGGLKYPLVADLTKKISADYGVLLDGGIALRGTVRDRPEGDRAGDHHPRSAAGPQRGRGAPRARRPPALREARRGLPGRTGSAARRRSSRA